MELTRRHALGVTAAIIAGSFVSGCVKTENKKLKAGYVKVLAALPFLMAHRNGFFTDLGLNIEPVEFGTSNDVAAAAVVGTIDFIGTGATNACLDAITASNKMMRIFTTNNYVKRPNLQSSDFLLSLPEYRTPESLKGKSIAFFPGTFGKMFANLILPKIGLSMGNINYVEMQPPQWLAALKGGAIQAVTALEPAASKIIESMKVNVLVDGYYAETMQRVPGSGTWFIDDKLDKDVERKIHQALLKAIDLIGSDRASANAAIADIFKLDAGLAEKVRLLDWHSVTSPEGLNPLKEFQNILESQGGIARPAPANNAWIWK